MTDPFPPYQIIKPAIEAAVPASNSLEDVARRIHSLRGRKGMAIEQQFDPWENPQGCRAIVSVTLDPKGTAVVLWLVTAGEDAAAVSKALEQTRPTSARAAA